MLHDGAGHQERRARSSRTDGARLGNRRRCTGWSAVVPCPCRVWVRPGERCRSIGVRRSGTRIFSPPASPWRRSPCGPSSPRAHKTSTAGPPRLRSLCQLRCQPPMTGHALGAAAPSPRRTTSARGTGSEGGRARRPRRCTGRPRGGARCRRGGAEKEARARAVAQGRVDPGLIAEQVLARRDRSAAARDRFHAKSDRAAARLDRIVSANERVESSMDGLTGPIAATPGCWSSNTRLPGRSGPVTPSCSPLST